MGGGLKEVLKSRWEGGQKMLPSIEGGRGVDFFWNNPI